MMMSHWQTWLSSKFNLFHAFVVTRLNYCGSLQYEFDDQHLARLQLIQNTTARMIMRITKI